MGTVLSCVIVLDGAGSGIDVIYGSKEKNVSGICTTGSTHLFTLAIRPIFVLAVVVKPHLHPRGRGHWTTLGVVIVPAIVDDRGAGISPGIDKRQR